MSLYNKYIKVDGELYELPSSNTDVREFRAHVRNTNKRYGKTVKLLTGTFETIWL